MVAIPKIIGVMCCGVVLCLGLSGPAESAEDVTKAGHHSGERIGGQAGRGYEPLKQEHIAASYAGERVGGQAGRAYEAVKREQIVATPHAGERIGGQAGYGYEQVKQEHTNAHAGVNEMEGMGK